MRRLSCAANCKSLEQNVPNSNPAPPISATWSDVKFSITAGRSEPSRMCNLELVKPRCWWSEEPARQTLQKLRQANVRVKHADGSALAEVDLSFDAIVVTAAAKYVPDDWTRLLNVGGKLVLPLSVGKADHQNLIVITRTDAGTRQEQFEAVRFVPLLPGLSG